MHLRRVSSKPSRWRRSIRDSTPLVPRPDLISWTGSRGSIIDSDCTRRSVIGRRSVQNPAPWLRNVVYVESRQGQTSPFSALVPPFLRDLNSMKAS